MSGLLDKLLRRRAEQPACAAVVAAAGSASRMEGVDKILAPMGQWPVLLHTLKALENSDLIREIVVVTREDLIVPVSVLCRDAALAKVTNIVVGGANRCQSVLNGIHEVREDVQLIAIQDGARPLVTTQIIDEAILRARECGAAAPAVPVKDTVKQARDAMVIHTPDRRELFAVQTPQVFQADLIRGALGKAMADGAELTDDCSAVERLGFPVALTQGSYENIKITTPVDLALGEAILNWRESR